MATPRSSPTSAGAVFLDKRRRIDELRRAARRAASRLPSITRAVLFGSLAAGTPTPRSDADILIILSTSDQPHMRERIPVVLAALSPLPCPVDLFVATVEEVERAEREGDPLVREALAHGLDLLDDGT